MAIEVQDGFNISTNKPVDDRYVKATLIERDAMVPEVRYIGLTCFVVSENIRYILRNGITNDDWEPDDGGEGGGGTNPLIIGSGEDGSWRFILTADGLELQVRVAGVWEKRGGWKNA